MRQAAVTTLPTPSTASVFTPAVSLQDILAQPRVPRRFVLPGLESGDVGILSAPGGVGKSFLVLAIAAAMGLGQPLFGLWPTTTVPSGVLYVSAEDDARELMDRLDSLVQSDPTLSPTAFARAHVIWPAQPALLMEKAGKWGNPTPNASALHDLIQAAQGVPDLRLIVLDPLNKLHGLDENSNPEMGQFLGLMGRLGQQLDCAVLLVHHANKLSATAGTGADQHSSRGASAIVDNARLLITLSTPSAKRAKTLDLPTDDETRRRFVIAEVAKINHGAKPDPLVLRYGPGGALQRVRIAPSPQTNATVVSVADMASAGPVDDHE